MIISIYKKTFLKLTCKQFITMSYLLDETANIPPPIVEATSDITKIS